MLTFNKRMSPARQDWADSNSCQNEWVWAQGIGFVLSAQNFYRVGMRTFQNSTTALRRWPACRKTVLSKETSDRPSVRTIKHFRSRRSWCGQIDL